VTAVADIAKAEILGLKTSLCVWSDFTSHKSKMFYILGPLDEAAVGLDPMSLEKVSNPQLQANAAVEDPKAKGKAPPAKAPPK
jgi:hypothetical protein